MSGRPERFGHPDAILFSRLSREGVFSTATGVSTQNALCRATLSPEFPIQKNSGAHRQEAHSCRSEKTTRVNSKAQTKPLLLNSSRQESLPVLVPWSRTDQELIMRLRTTRTDLRETQWSAARSAFHPAANPVIFGFATHADYARPAVRATISASGKAG